MFEGSQLKETFKIKNNKKLSLRRKTSLPAEFPTNRTNRNGIERSDERTLKKTKAKNKIALDTETDEENKIKRIHQEINTIPKDMHHFKTGHSRKSKQYRNVEKKEVQVEEDQRSYEINENLLVTDFLTRPSAKTGFQKGLKPEKILGATKFEGCLYIAIKFHGEDETQLIASDIVRQKVPHMMIKFYESNLTWDSDNEM